MDTQHTAPAYDVVGLGNAIVDVIAPVDDAFLDAHAMTKGAMTLVDEDRALALDRNVREAGDVVQTPGGSAANTVAGLAALGMRAGYIYKVADDAMGREFTRGLRGDGLAAAPARSTEGPATARCIIAVTPDGERTMNTFLGASVEFGEGDVDEALVASGATLYLEGYLFDAEPAKRAFVHAAEVARAHGRRVALTLSDTFCVERHRASFRQLVGTQTDIVFANEAEALALWEVETLDAAADRFADAGVLTFVTRGADGATVVRGPERHHVPTRAVERVVDTTGAGDQFAAGALAGLAMGMGAADAARLGNLAAGEVIGHYGPRPEASVHELALREGLRGEPWETGDMSR